ncbi:MAG: AAA family ATPase, partial [Aggregatilineales bacterium]
MLTQLRLENFKSWRVLDIELAPITLLFGVNSSGKSSVLQALLLLKQTLVRYDRSQPLNAGERNIDYVFLGDYPDFIYSHDTSLPLAISLTFKTSESPQQPLFDPSPGEIRYDAEWRLTDGLSRQDRFHPDENWAELEKVLDRLAYLAPVRAYPERVYQQRSAAPRRLNRYGENLVDVLLAAERRGAQAIGAIE